MANLVSAMEIKRRGMTGAKGSGMPGLSAMQWLLAQRPVGKRSKQQIDRRLSAERGW